MREYLHLFGRFGLSLMFVVEGLLKALEFDESLLILKEEEFPMPLFTLIFSIIVELIGGLAIVIGYKTTIAALAISIYLIITTVFFHPVWHDMAFFMDFVKNIAIIGGLFILAYYGGGPKSVDAYHQD